MCVWFDCCLMCDVGYLVWSCACVCTCCFYLMWLRDLTVVQCVVLYVLLFCVFVCDVCLCVWCTLLSNVCLCVLSVSYGVMSCGVCLFVFVWRVCVCSPVIVCVAIKCIRVCCLWVIV